MSRRVLVADPDPDVRALVEQLLESLGYEPVRASILEPPPAVDAIVLEPSCTECVELLERFGAAPPPVICFSVYPPEAGLAPPASVAYLVKPASREALGAVLGRVLAG